jgi:uncharacterized protein (TIGR00297 family)
MTFPSSIIIMTLAGMLVVVLMKKLTPAASVSGGLIAMLVHAASGITGYMIMAVFFISATLATAWKRDQKKLKTISDHGPRDAGQVWANSGLAAIAGIFSLLGDYPVIPLLIAAVFSSAMADTISSEMGMVTGKRFVNIISFKPDIKGRDGVISLEGSLWGLGGSLLIAVIYSWGYGWSSHFFFIIIAGTMGNLTDSILGATWERGGKMGNNMVNFLNTLVAVVVILFLYFITGS